MTIKKTIILFIVAIGIMTLIMVGYAFSIHENQTVTTNTTTIPTVIPTITKNTPVTDFPVHIKLNDPWEFYRYYDSDIHPPTNTTSIITKNFSEIEANNYADIPILIPPGDICQISDFEPYENVNRTATIALNNVEFQDILRNGGIINGIYYAYPDHMTAHGSPCAHATLEFGFINGTNAGKVHVNKAPYDGCYIDLLYA